jgi:tryptophan-rich sensory protein
MPLIDQAAVNAAVVAIFAIWLPTLLPMDLRLYHNAIANDEIVNPQSMTKKKRKFREKFADLKHLWRIPDLVYPAAWTIEYGLISASIVLFLLAIPSYGVALTTKYVSIWGLFVGYIILNHSWGVVFFRYIKYQYMRAISAGMTFVMLAAAITILVLMICEGGLMVPYILWAIHIPWLVVALVVNINWAYNRIDVKDPVTGTYTDTTEGLLPSGQPGLRQRVLDQ